MTGSGGPPRVWLAAWLGYPGILLLALVGLVAMHGTTPRAAAWFMLAPADGASGLGLLALALMAAGLVKSRSVLAVSLGFVGCVIWVGMAAGFHGLSITWGALD